MGFAIGGSDCVTLCDYAHPQLWFTIERYIHVYPKKWDDVK